MTQSDFPQRALGWIDNAEYYRDFYRIRTVAIYRARSAPVAISVGHSNLHHVWAWQVDYFSLGDAPISNNLYMAPAVDFWEYGYDSFHGDLTLTEPGYFMFQATLFEGYVMVGVIIDGDAAPMPEPMPAPAPQVAPSVEQRRFTADTMVNVDGVNIPAIHFAEVSGARVTTISGRVFTEMIGGTTAWDSATNTATFTGYNPDGELVVAELTTGSPNARVNGELVDIATTAMQPQFAGQIAPVVVDGRQYAPARFLANVFGIPIDFEGGANNMTIIFG
jgi:hypothetical protein